MSKPNFVRATVLVVFSVLIARAGFSFGTGASSFSKAESSGGEYLPNKIVIKFKPGQTFGGRLSKTGVASFDALLGSNNVARLERVSKGKSRLGKGMASAGIENIYYVYFNGGESPLSVARAFKYHPLVEYAEPLRVYRLTATPNDPLFSQQFNFQVIQAQAAWDVVKGEQGNVVVAVVDGGTDVDHGDLAANIWRNPGESGSGRESNNIDDDNNGFVDDFQGWNFANNSNDPSGLSSTPTSANHGSHVGGIVSAVSDNSNQVAGVSWNAKLMPINAAVDGQDNVIGFGYAGIIYAAENGADIINLSWGGGGAPSLFEQDIIDYATSLGSVIVAAAGNESSSAPHFPSSYKNVFSVAATGDLATGDLKKADFSNFGPTVDLAAPGQTIRSTFHNGATGIFSGTSMASPHVAGVVALVKTLHPDWTNVQAAEQVRATADNTDAANPGFENQMGSGRVNALKAVTVTTPSIRIADVRFIDANGNGVIERNETVEVLLNLTNFLAPASNISLTLEENDPFVSITSNSANIASLGTLETTASPLSFSIRTTSSAPSGRQLNFVLRIASGDYQDRERFTLVVQPLFENANINNITLSLTGIGRIGFATTEADEPTDGFGFSFNRGPNLLFEGAILAGTGPSIISNAARGIGETGGHVFDRDFVTANDGPLRIITPGAITDQESFTIFEDVLSNTPMNLRITQESFAMSAAPNDNFILLRYTIQNSGQSTLANFHFGLFFDWDLGTPQEVFQNQASYDAVRRMGIVSHSNTFVGAMSLGTANIHYRAINNLTINDSNGFTDAEKWQALSSGLSATFAGPADVSHVIANGPFSIPPSQSITLDYALLAANSLVELQSTATAAQVFWSQLITDVEDPGAPGIPTKFALLQNYPNPFNPTTEIRYDLAQAAEVELTVYNLLGQKIRTLVKARQAAGFHSVQWDGANAAGEIVASGVYLYQLRAGGFVQTHKMLFIK